MLKCWSETPGQRGQFTEHEATLKALARELPSIPIERDRSKGLGDRTMSDAAEESLSPTLRSPQSVAPEPLYVRETDKDDSEPVLYTDEVQAGPYLLADNAAVHASGLHDAGRQVCPAAERNCFR
jgi:hypothetical protein